MSSVSRTCANWPAGLMATLLAVGLMNASAFAADYSANASDPRVDTEATLKVGSNQPAATLDPHLASQGGGDFTYTTPIFDRLLRLNGRFELQPMLAKSWRFARDGTYLELDLRDDVKFHDGTRFDAAAVKANVERAKTGPRSTAAAALTTVQGVDIVNDFKVRLRLTPGQGATLPFALAVHAGAMISPKALADPTRDLALNPGDAGSGPYIATQIKTNEVVFYERAPTPTWDKGAGLAKKLEIHTIRGAAALRAIQSGAVDTAHLTSVEIPTALNFVKSRGGDFTALPDQNGTYYGVYFRSTRPSLSNPRVRQAIAMAIDRPALQRSVFNSACTTATQFFPAHHWAHVPDWVDHRFDPAKAKAEIKAAGAEGTKIEILGPGQEFDSAAIAIQAMLKDVGLDVTVSTMLMTDAIVAFRGRNRDALSFAVGGDAHPGNVFSAIFVGGLGMMPEAELPALKGLLAKADNPTLNAKEQMVVYRQVYELAAKQAVVFPLCFAQQLFVSKKNVLFTDSINERPGIARDFRFLAKAK